MQLKKPDTYFPELDGEQQRLADEWLLRYLRLVLRIMRERTLAQKHAEEVSSS